MKLVADNNLKVLKYDPDGNRVYKESTVSGQTTKRKYIVDRVGDLPTILLELDPLTNYSIKKTYVYGNSQILMQHDGTYTAPRYFYLHDRLGSVRQVINSSGAVVCRYTYNPFGELHTTETEENILNPFKFAGQWLDIETGDYYMRNRQYTPPLCRFTSHDPVSGKFEQPLSLHKYLYCWNDPINRLDPAGLWTIHLTQSGMLSFGASAMEEMGIVIDDDGNVGFITTVGFGGGTPAASLVGSLGWTNADTIFKLKGWGASVGGSLGTALSGGVNVLMGEKYIGLEGNFGWSWAPIIEMHGHATYTTVGKLDVNWRDAVEAIREMKGEMLYNVQTLGEGYTYLIMNQIIEDVINEGKSGIAEKLLPKY